MKHCDKLIIASIFALSATHASASMIVFDDQTDSNYQLSTTGTFGNPDALGSVLTYTGFTVSGGFATSNVLTGSGFNKSDITASVVDQDASPSHGGLGVCSESSTCAGSSDSLSSNTNAGGDPGGDEILFFDFFSATFLETVYFNGDHASQLMVTWMTTIRRLQMPCITSSSVPMAGILTRAFLKMLANSNRRIWNILMSLPQIHTVTGP